jgi:hypothetical protein
VTPEWSLVIIGAGQKNPVPHCGSEKEEGMFRFRRVIASAVVVLAAAAIAAPAGAVEPSEKASCLGQYVFFLAQTSAPNLGQGVVAPGATSSPGVIAANVVPDATKMPHTYHCSPT